MSLCLFEIKNRNIEDFTSDEILDRMITAANSIPEGAPVGTIARRPDGSNIAHRVSDGEHPYWVYFYGKHWDKADSWPVIYDPDEYREGDKPRLERLMREPSVFEAHLTAQQEPEQGWLRQEFDKAEKRSAQVPDRAKPKVVRPDVG